MKKLMILLSAVGMCACTAMNKNTVSYQISKYDPQVYYVVAGEGETEDAAAAAARKNMLQNLEQNVPDVNQIEQLGDLVANAKTGKVWRDKRQKKPKHYYALAVLKRSVAESILKTPANELDARLGALATQLQTKEDKFAGLRAAFAMEPLLIKSNILQDLYTFVSSGHEGYEADRFDTYKKLYNDRLAAVKVLVAVQGDSSKTLISHVTDAINRMGLSAVETTDSSAQLAVEVVAKVDEYKSDTIRGLEWASSSASFSLKDLQGGTFSRFNLSDRAGTGRRSDSVRKSMDGIGTRAADEIVQRLTDYLKTK